MTGLPGEDGQLDDAEERIESYLDELLLTLRGRPREARGLLSEVDSHLRESIEAGLAAGLDQHAGGNPPRPEPHRRAASVSAGALWARSADEFLETPADCCQRIKDSGH